MAITLKINDEKNKLPSADESMNQIVDDMPT
jgi:hypothetical protein